jgi:hypothetical protein
VLRSVSPVARRDQALRASAWLIAAGLVAGMFVFGKRAVTTEQSERAARDAARKAAEAEKPLSLPLVPDVLVQGARKMCREAIDAAEQSLIWAGAEKTCREQLQLFGGEAELKAMTMALQCRDWRERVEASERPGDATTRELNRWLTEECDPLADGGERVRRLPTAADRCPESLREVAEVAQDDLEQAWRDLARLERTCRGFPERETLKASLRARRMEAAKTACAESAKTPPVHLQASPCVQYAALHYCPDLEAFNAPPGKKLVLKGPLGATGWRPKDPLLVLLLRQQAALNLRPGFWRCTSETLRLVPDPRQPLPLKRSNSPPMKW